LGYFVSSVFIYVFIYLFVQKTNNIPWGKSIHLSACNTFGLPEFLRSLLLKCPIKIFRHFMFGLDKAQEVGRQLLTTGARLRSQANFYGICEGNLPMRQVFLRVIRWSAVGIFPPFGPCISVMWQFVSSS